MVVQTSDRRRGPALLRAAACGAAGLLLLALVGISGPPGDAPVPLAGPGSVVVAARPLAAGHRVAPDDVRLDAISPSPTGLLRSASQALGRRMAVAVGAGTPLVAALLLDGGAASGRRRLRLSVDSAAVAPDLQPGASAEVLAAVDDGPTGAHREGAVAVVEVAGIEEESTAATRPSDATQGRAPSSHRLAVTVDCAAADATRLAWAADFARALHLVAHPPGDSTAAPVVSPW